MKIYAVVAEYDPFHDGHRYHLEETRRRGADRVAAVMSGSVTQRGDVAVYDKHFRAKEACRGGADLVVELPCPFSCASAEIFATKAIEIVAGLGCADGISFGCEIEDIGLLKSAAAASEELKDSVRIKELLAGGMSYPAAFGQACREQCGEQEAQVFSFPNALLGVEYIKAIKKLGANLDIMVIKRKGQPHGSVLSGGYVSGTYLREQLRRHIPGEEISRSVYDMDKYAGLIGYMVSSRSREELGELPDSSPELAARLKLADPSARSIEELAQGIKSRNFTLARIRRVILYAILGIKRQDMELQPYGRILAANRLGLELLPKVGEGCINFSGSLKRLSEASGGSRRLAELDRAASKLQAACWSKGAPLAYRDEFTVRFMGEGDQG